MRFTNNSMPTKPRQSKKKAPTRQLGCRAEQRDELLITAALEVDPLRRNRNTFIVLAATAEARKVLEAAGVDIEALYSEHAGASKRSRKSVAA